MSITINVYLNRDLYDKRKVIFSRYVSISDAVFFNFNNMVDVMHLLFGDECYIEFITAKTV